MNKTERIKALIATGKTLFTEADQTMLETVDEPTLARFEAAAAAPVKVEEKPAPKAAEKAEEKPEVKVAEKAAEPVAPKFEDVLKTASQDTQDLINGGLAIGKARKDATIKTLVDSGRCDITAAELGKRSQGELDSLVKLAGIAPKAAADVDYSGLAPRQGAADQGVPPAPDFNARMAERKTKK